MSVIVIGSGISGLSIANILVENCKVEVLEKSSKIGGLIKCDRIKGNLFHRVGGHVFNSRNQKVTDWFWQYFDKEKEFLKAKRNAKIDICSTTVGYPIENYIYQLPDDIKTPILSEIIEKINQDKVNIQYTNFKEFLIGNFGQTLYKLYFEPYNKKIWNVNLDDIPLDWLKGKLPMPDLKEVILSNVLRKEEDQMVHSSFYYPKEGGSQFIVDRFAEALNISVSYTVNSIELNNNKLSINHGERITDKLIYTGDVRNLHRIINIDDNELNDSLLKARGLKSNGTSNVLCEMDNNDLSWRYIPEHQFKAHRIIYTGNFSDSNNASLEKKTCVVEFSGEHNQNAMIKELGSLPGNLRPLAFNYEPNSYIIHNKDTKKIINKIKNLLEPYNIYLLGRFAEWEYYNMDKCIESAMLMANKKSFIDK
jgi:protoporphyrinogen oxidase